VGLELDRDDAEDIVKSHNRELTTEDLQELDSFTEHDSGEEEQEDDALTTAQLNEFLNSWDTVKKYASRHPSIEQTELQICLFDDKVVSYLKKLLMEKRKAVQQSTSDSFFRKKPRLEPPSSNNSENPYTCTSPDHPEVIMEGDYPSKN
jgi:hypothetical protein